jgi:hypothetical protein
MTYTYKKPHQLRRFAIDRLKDRTVASQYYDEPESELQGVQAQPLCLDKKYKKLVETIQGVGTNTIGYKQIKRSLTRNVEKRTRKRTPPESELYKTTPEMPRMLTN